MSRKLQSFKSNLIRFVVLFCIILLPVSLSIPKAASAADLNLVSGIPMVSLTFDDGDQTIYSNGFPILNTYGIPGTLYMITDSLTPTWNGQLKNLENHGWEVGSHSVNHLHMDTISDADQILELSQSKAALQAAGVSVNGFAYPYGSGSSDADIQARVAQYYSDARSVTPGYNNSQSLQRYALFSMAQDVNTSLGTMKGWVDQAIANKTWLIICMHTVDNTGDEYSISPENLTSLVSYIKSKVDAGTIRAVNVRDGLSLYGGTLPGPVISNLSAAPGTTSANITWTTNTTSSTIVDYGLTASYATTLENTQAVTSHAVNLSGLTTCTTYHYRARSRDANNIEGTTLEQTFTTAGCDVTPPVISNVGAAPNANQAVITWTTNEPTSSRVEYGLTSSYGSTTGTDTSLRTSHSITVTGLTACTPYHYNIHAKDAALNENTSGDNTFTTTGCDFTPPVISNVGAAPSANQVVITWRTDEQVTSWVEYGLTSSYGSTTETDTSVPLSHSVTVTGLAACTPYHYNIHAKDAALNENTSGDNTFTTTGCDFTPPVISSVAAVPLTTQIEINWFTEEASSSFVEYGVKSTYGSATQWTDTVQLVNNHSVTLPTTQACTLYHYRIHSKDIRQNEGISQDYTVTTPCYKIFLGSITK